jgi:glucosamine-6-phosphate deaminase
MRVYVTKDYDAMSKRGAEIVAREINNFKPTKKKKFFVLGLATGSTPIGMYKQLIKLNKAGKVSFKKVATFNLDEYLLLEPKHPESYHSFMFNQLFSHIDINKKNVNIPDGMAKNVEKFCADYEKKMKKMGGIDLQVLGIGGDGHIGFNEPGSSLASRTRAKTLNPQTIKDNYELFFKESGYDITDVPIFAITMGVGTVMDARKCLLFASGKKKAGVLAAAAEGPITSEITASLLQMHPDATFIVDEGAASKLNKVTYYKAAERGEEEFAKLQALLKKGVSIKKARQAQKGFLQQIMKKW